MPIFYYFNGSSKSSLRLPSSRLRIPRVLNLARKVELFLLVELSLSHAPRTMVNMCEQKPDNFSVTDVLNIHVCIRYRVYQSRSEPYTGVLSNLVCLSYLFLVSLISFLLQLFCHRLFHFIIDSASLRQFSLCLGHCLDKQVLPQSA
jgi:hypothetical protein